ncbi:MaoC/PaaZ C-terminal domain-containing protein [Microbacterium sp. NPDC058062]|uniref:MaoC/PaaZ C-terminal domain-containing protein n=1 Tax=Microbacterium sp. NPDC058062 TaxID=3346320 RepID=UPI0036D7BB61
MSSATLDQERLRTWPFRDVRVTYTEKDTILYALSIGLGADPTDAAQLPYVYERDLIAFPTMLTTLGMYQDDQFITDPGVGIDLSQMLHTEMALTIHRPFPATGEVHSRISIDRLIDRGEGRGAILDFSRQMRSASGELIATESGSFFLRGNGGFGGSNGERPRLPAVPDRPADRTAEIDTSRSAALLFRLIGDRNPIHVDPEVARRGGFPAPILHGGCTFGVAVHGVVRSLLNYQTERLRHVGARFSAPVLPGDTLMIEVWDHGDGRAAFRASVPAREMVVVDNGVVVLDQ